jgi:sarcosine oxidase subunit beta
VLGAHVLGAAFCELDGDVNPIRAALAFASAARRHGARILARTCVTGIRRAGGTILGVETDAGPIAAKVVVNAAGVWAPALGAMVGVTIPIRPRRGMILVTDIRPRTVSGTVLSAEYLVSKFAHDEPPAAAGVTTRLAGGLVAGQTRSGNLLIGSTREWVGQDTRVTREGLAHIGGRALRMMPDLRHVNVIRTYAGLRPATPDGLPVLGPVPGVEGFIVAAGHEGDGIALAPWTGQVVADLIAGRAVPESLQRFALRRFGDREDARGS